MIPFSKISILSCLIYLAPLMSAAQHFNYAAELDKVDTTGFYAITVSPQLSAYIKTDFSDIRIADKNKQWVPHILQPVKTTPAQDQFTPFPILENSLTDSGKNLLIIENTTTNGIYNLNLFIKNSAVSRTAILSGSKNRRDWFIIDDKVPISRSYEMAKDEYLQEINFPLAKYRYLKIIIDNAHNDPLQITKSGLYAQPSYKSAINYQDNPATVFTQTDSNNYSYVEVRQDNNYQFDKILIVADGVKFYDREIQLCLPIFGKENIAKPGTVIGSFRILSGQPAMFVLPRTKAVRFFIVIKNADNPPLKIKKVSTQQQSVSLITYLEQGKKYELLMSDSLALFADYDLQTFKDSIIKIHTVGYGSVHPINKIILDRRHDNQKSWIWAFVILAGIVLSLLTYRLTGDINKQKNN